VHPSNHQSNDSLDAFEDLKLAKSQELVSSDWFRNKSKPLVTARFAVIQKSRESLKSAYSAQAIQMSLKQKSLLNSSLPWKWFARRLAKNGHNGR